MRALPPPTGIRIVDEPFVQNGFDHVTHRVVHHAVAEGSRLDGTLLGVGHDELAIATVAIPPGRKLPSEPHEMLLEVAAELQDGRAVALARARVAVCAMEVLEINDLIKEIHG